MIIDLEKFIGAERPFWNELEETLDRLTRDAAAALDLEESKRLHYLYERAAAGLSKLATFAAEPQVHAYLQALVARAYAEIHESARPPFRLQAKLWFMSTFPTAFRRRQNAFYSALCLFFLGGIFGAGIIFFDYDSKSILMPLSHLSGDPSERVAFEENRKSDPQSGSRSTFSALLMQNNIRVSIMALALGMTFGVGTIIVLFSNGVLLGAVACDYVLAGETTFLLGWLLPHGVIEIPAILLGGQAGLVLGMALIGWGNSLALRERLRLVRADLVTLMIGVAIMLIWAGIIESFVSQYHAPFIYGAKIAFGAAQLVLLTAYLSRAGRNYDPLLDGH